MKKLLLIAVAGLALGFGAVMLVLRQAERSSSPNGSVFQTSLEAHYDNLFEAAMLVGVQVPGGASMPLERLLALTSRNGMQRLDDSSIGELVRLRSEFVASSDTASCAAIWSGANAALVAAIEKLPAEQQQQWAGLFTHAAQATIDRLPQRPAPPRDQYEAALDRVLARLPQDQLDDIKAALNDSWRLTPAEECRAARAFYGGLQADQSDGVTITRAMLYQ
jgi:hypothetical protein